MLVHRFFLVKLFLKFRGFIKVTFFECFLDLIFKLLLSGLVLLGDFLEFFCHLLKVLGKLFHFDLIEITILKLLGQLLDRFGRLFHITFAHRIGQLFRRPLTSILQFVQALFKIFAVAHFLTAILKLFLNIVELYQSVFLVEIFIVKNLVQFFLKRI